MTFVLLGSIFGVLFDISIVLTLAVLFSIERKKVVRFIATLWGKKREIAYIKMKKIYTKLGVWIKNQLFLSFYIFLISFLGLHLLSLFGVDVPHK